MKCDTCKMKYVCDALERMGKVPKHEKCHCYIPLQPPTSADVVEVRRAYWEKFEKLIPLPIDVGPLDWNKYDEQSHSEWEEFYRCSQCKKEEYSLKPSWDYCPDCGAKMGEKA